MSNAATLMPVENGRSLPRPRPRPRLRLVTVPGAPANSGSAFTVPADVMWMVSGCRNNQPMMVGGRRRRLRESAGRFPGPSRHGTDRATRGARAGGACPADSGGPGTSREGARDASRTTGRAPTRRCERQSRDSTDSSGEKFTMPWDKQPGRSIVKDCRSCRIIWDRIGVLDSNPGPPAPKAGALPDCATPRRQTETS